MKTARGVYDLPEISKKGPGEQKGSWGRAAALFRRGPEEKGVLGKEKGSHRQGERGGPPQENGEK